jgi:predicted nucleotidyltransferase
MKINVDITPEHHQIVHGILNRHLPKPCTVWAFGSRANHTAQAYSDLDLACDAGKKLEYDTITQLKVAFEESRLPYTVDVVDHHRIEPYFKRIIDHQKVLFLSNNHSPFG